MCVVARQLSAVHSFDSCRCEFGRKVAFVKLNIAVAEHYMEFFEVDRLVVEEFEWCFGRAMSFGRQRVMDESSLVVGKWPQAFA